MNRKMRVTAVEKRDEYVYRVSCESDKAKGEYAPATSLSFLVTRDKLYEFPVMSEISIHFVTSLDDCDLETAEVAAKRIS